MNRRFYFICIAALFTLWAPVLIATGVPLLGDLTATVHGETYEGVTFEHMNNTVIEINSTPPQSIVAKNGKYSFELAPGDYAITARYYQNNTLTYSRETTFKIEDEGSYVFDLLLYPASESPTIGENAAITGNPNQATLTGQIRNKFLNINYLSIAFTFLLLLGTGYKFSSKHKKKTQVNSVQKGKKTPIKRNFSKPINGFLTKILAKGIGPEMKQELTANIKETTSIKEPITESAKNSEETTTLKKNPLSADLQEVVYIIKGHNGQITQKDLRSRLNYSEVKVSTMLSELEKRGIIRKSKNGRENTVILVDEEYLKLI